MISLTALIFCYLYRAHDHRVFTIDDVTFVETDLQLPEFSGNMEMELSGLQDIDSEDKALVDANAVRDNEVNWDQLALSKIDEQVVEPVCEDVGDTLPSQIETVINESANLVPQDPHQVNGTTLQ